MNTVEIGARLEQLANIATELRMENDAARAREAKARLEFTKAHLVVIGEFNRGKSTFVNGLIGEELLPMDIVPTTAAIWTIEKGTPRSTTIVYRDGTRETIPATAESLARLSADGDLCKPAIRFVEIKIPTLSVGDDVVIIDTPGVNDINEQRSEITYGFLSNADAAVFLMDASAPLTKSEAEFLEGQVLDAALQKILFVMNKIDRLDEDELEEAALAAKERLSALLKRDIRPVGYAAGRVLPAIAKDNVEAASRWGWSELGDRLSDLLRETRSSENREQTARRRIAVLGRHLKAEVERRIQVASMKSSEIASVRADFEQACIAMEAKFVRFADYGNSQGRERLKAMLARSIEHRSGEFIQQEELRINGMKGDFKLYGEKVLPYQVQLFVKNWFESTRPKIEQFLVEFTAVMSSEFSKNFGGGIEFRGALDLGDSSSGGDLSSVELEDFNEYVGLALPGAAGMAAMFLLGGPFTIIGMGAGMLLQKGLRDRKAEEMREIVREAVPRVVGDAGDRVLLSMSSAIDQWFDSLERALYTQLETMLLERRGAFAREESGSDAERADRVADYGKQLRDLQGLVLSA